MPMQQLWEGVRQHVRAGRRQYAPAATHITRLGLAVDHLRVENLDPATLPAWQRTGVTGEG